MTPSAAEFQRRTQPFNPDSPAAVEARAEVFKNLHEAATLLNTPLDDHPEWHGVGLIIDYERGKPVVHPLVANIPDILARPGELKALAGEGYRTACKARLDQNIVYIDWYEEHQDKAYLAASDLLTIRGRIQCVVIRNIPEGINELRQSPELPVQLRYTADYLASTLHLVPLPGEKQTTDSLVKDVKIATGFLQSVRLACTLPEETQADDREVN